MLQHLQVRTVGRLRDNPTLPASIGRYRVICPDILRTSHVCLAVTEYRKGNFRRTVCCLRENPALPAPQGTEFFSLGDHKPRTYASRSRSTEGGAHTAREVRHMSRISECTMDIRCIKGVDNAVADALSHSPVSAITLPTGIDLKKNNAMMTNYTAYNKRQRHHTCSGSP